MSAKVKTFKHAGHDITTTIYFSKTTSSHKQIFVLWHTGCTPDNALGLMWPFRSAHSSKATD